MAGPPYIKFYPAHWDADTILLDDAEELAYFRICKEMWKSGRPLREKIIPKAIRYTDEQWAEVRPAVVEYFCVTDGVWHHDRVEADIEEVYDLVAKKSKAGKASVLARQAKKRAASKANQESNADKPPAATGDGTGVNSGVGSPVKTDDGTIREENKKQNNIKQDNSTSDDSAPRAALKHMWVPAKHTIFELRDEHGIPTPDVWPKVVPFRALWTDSDQKTDKQWQEAFKQWILTGVKHESN